MKELALFSFAFLVLSYNLIYLDTLGARYRQGRTQKLDTGFKFKLFLSLHVVTHTLAFLSLLTSSPILFLLPSGDFTRFTGLFIMGISLLVIRLAKWNLGRNYSPCQDSYFPTSITGNGVYAYIRHPLYTGNILYFLGMTIASQSLWSILLFCAFIWFFNRSARLEEQRLSERFPEYAAYMRRTKRFIPFIF